MKKLLAIFLSFAVSAAVIAQKSQVDSVAIMILDHMSDVIGGLNSCSFKLTTSRDIVDYDFGTIKRLGYDEVQMSGPDKMVVKTSSDRGENGYWCNGEDVFYYSFTENNFATVKAQTDIVSTITNLNQSYGIDFPAADFFYPTFTDDIIANYPVVKYAGMKNVEGNPCFHIIASNEKQTVQFWIANDTFFLPKKFVLTYKDKDNLQYEATFNDWIVNPDLPDAIFSFLAPPNAHRINLLPISAK